jgi:hypothetical protein
MTKNRYIIKFSYFSCEVVVSGKLRGQRAKSMKFVDGLMIHSGDPCNDYVDTACRHVLLRQGVLGIKVCRIIVICYGFGCPGSGSVLGMRIRIQEHWN